MNAVTDIYKLTNDMENVSIEARLLFDNETVSTTTKFTSGDMKLNNIDEYKYKQITSSQGQNSFIWSMKMLKTVMKLKTRIEVEMQKKRVVRRFSRPTRREAIMLNKNSNSTPPRVTFFASYIKWNEL